MSVDPADNETFWFTTEYIGTGGSRKTKIASFKIGNAPVATTLPATAITGNSATINGTINPNSLPTNYHFEWGTTVAYGTNTATISAGTGSTNVAVFENLSGLVGGTTYHFRVVATNSDGTTNGADLTFTPGGAVVTTTAVTGITLTGATSGGSVTTDGGSAVTARGVCWAATANPVATGNHTTDGTGTGTFVSTITGLSANSTYHVRAYATNANGTYYGADLTFTTLCGVYTLPFTESFPGATIPTCWSQLDNQGGGQIWQFGTISGQSPNPALTGNYAYLNSDAYGTGFSQNADLITPTIDMSGFSAVNLQFKHYFKSLTGSSGTLSYSINNGTSWTIIQTFTTTSATNPVTFNQAIAAVVGQSAVKFKWNYIGTFAWYWAIDDINITGTGVVTLAVTPPNQNVTPPAGTTPFAVTTTANWTATSDAAWCTVTPSGTGNGTLTATYTQNTGAASRVANITVAAPGAASVIVTVTQGGTSPTLTVTPPNQNVTSPAGNTTFTVTSNSAWIVVSNAAWCTVTLSGTGNGTITATYTSNAFLVSRVANVTVTVTGLAPVVVTVTQAAGSPVLTVTPANQNVSSPAGNTSFAVTSNIAWTTSSNAAWCTVTPSGTGDGTILATYTANVATSSRVATITVSGPGATPVNVTVTQSGTTPTLSVTPANQNVSFPAGNTNFTVTSNSAWTALSNAAWCTVTASGSGNGTLVATYLENTTLSARVANITVTVAGIGPVVVTVTQAATSPTLTVSPINQTVPATAGIANYSVITNSTWTATSNTFWCNLTPSGSGNGTLVATYEANPTTDERISYITVSVPGVPNANLTLTQVGSAPFLSVDPHVQNVGDGAGTTNFAVSTNMPWTAVSNSPWCTITGSGTGNGTIVATFTDNTFASGRTASITVTAAGIAPVMVTVVQSGPAAMLNVTPATRTVTDPAGSTTFNVSSNTNWSCSSDQLWCQPTPSGTGIGLMTATYSQNLTQVIRTANIQINGTGATTVWVQLVQLPSFVSLDENPENALEVFPNPTTGLFVISSASNQMLEMKVSILNAKGKTILTRQCKGSNNYTFDLSQAASGNYFMKVETDGKTHVLKLVVQ